MELLGFWRRGPSKELHWDHQEGVTPPSGSWHTKPKANTCCLCDHEQAPDLLSLSFLVWKMGRRIIRLYWAGCGDLRQRIYMAVCLLSGCPSPGFPLSSPCIFSSERSSVLPLRLPCGVASPQSWGCLGELTLLSRAFSMKMNAGWPLARVTPNPPLTPHLWDSSVVAAKQNLRVQAPASCAPCYPGHRGVIKPLSTPYGESAHQTSRHRWRS